MAKRVRLGRSFYPAAINRPRLVRGWEEKEIWFGVEWGTPHGEPVWSVILYVELPGWFVKQFWHHRWPWGVELCPYRQMNPGWTFVTERCILGKGHHGRHIMRPVDA